MIFPNLEKQLKENNGVWKNPRELLEYASFNTIYCATFGVPAVFKSKEYEEILFHIRVSTPLPPSLPLRPLPAAAPPFLLTKIGHVCRRPCHFYDL